MKNNCPNCKHGCFAGICTCRCHSQPTTTNSEKTSSKLVDTPTSNTLEELKREFEEICIHEFDDCSAHGEGQYCCLDVEHRRHHLIKSFLTKVYGQAYEAGYQKGYNQGQHDAINWEREADNGVAKAVAEEKQKLIKLVEGKRKTPNYQLGGGYERDEAYNSALQDILTTLKNINE